MIDPNRVTEAVMEFMKNPEWKEIFVNAPGGAMERLAISFYFSKFHDQFKPEDFQEYRDLRDEYEKSLTEEDLTYLVENSDKDKAKQHYQELLTKLQESGGQPQGNMRFEKETETVKGEEGEEKPEAPAAEGGDTEQGEDGQEGEEQPAVEEKVEGQEETPAQEGEEEATSEEEASTSETEQSPNGEVVEEKESVVETEEKPIEQPAEEDPEKKKDLTESEQPQQDEKYNTALSVALEYLQKEQEALEGEKGKTESPKTN